MLASDLAFLLTADEAWTRHNLLPLFASDSDDFYVAWDGFLTWGRLNPAVAECMEQMFLQAVGPLTSIEFGPTKEIHRLLHILACVLCREIRLRFGSLGCSNVAVKTWV